MKKILLFLGLFVLLTTGLYAQEPANCNVMETIPPRSCIGVTSIYGARVNAAGNGLTIRWTIPVNQTNAYFTDGVGTNLGTSIDRIAVGSDPDGTLNNVLVNVGNQAGSLTVVMQFLNPDLTPNPLGSCSSSRLVRDVNVSATAPDLTCPTDVTTITAVAVTQVSFGVPFVPSPPYLYTLNPGTPGAISNATGIFPGVGAGSYTISAREVLVGGGFGCDDTTTIIIAPVAPNPLVLNCPANVDRAACASQAELEGIFQAWLTSFSVSGGFEPVITVRTPAGPVSAPNHCGGLVTVTWTVTDNCEQSDTCTRTFLVRDSLPPVITCAPGGDLGCNPTIPGPTAPTITSACPTLPYTYNDVITGTDCARTLTRTYTVTNECQQTATCDQVFTYKIDLVDPELVNVPAGGDLGCNPPTLPSCDLGVTGTDNCPGAVTVRCSGATPTNEGCYYRQVFTYTAIDECLNDVSREVVYTWKIDTTAPTILCSPNKEVECDAAVVFDTPTAEDNCTATGDIVITPGPIVVVNNADGSVSHTQSWTARDECNNTSVACSQTVLVAPCVEPNGCTLGYWKNHTLAWDCYSTCTLYKDVFTGSTLDPNLTLLQALNLGGGACNNLARQSVAALLNICDGTLDYSVANIAALQTLVNTAFANGTCGAAGSLLDRYNNLGGANHCDVVKSPNTSESTCTTSRTSTKKGVNATGEVAPSAIFKTYPNPFGNTFSIQSSNTVSPINVSIFDVLGRSVETRILNPDEFDSPTFGRDFPTGIYNVILNQATEQRTLRVIKQ